MNQIKPMAASWARSFLAAAVAVYMAGVTDPKAIASAGLAAVLPVILRWLNPNDSSFGVKGK
ncbi:hypothetical protein UFOVP796_14 [uncultured Caudovirales phage]|jgi:hypothetical protein|uniref:Holin n=1 Tax=uncultured Caudovirales phage TaxID=2100421 RepID=A0A6J5NWK4_9CAUD|nr:hypothetical protein UFOVP796_14 [uncultured Caudovirales phage]